MNRIVLIALLLSISACEPTKDCETTATLEILNLPQSEQPTLPELPAPEHYGSCQELIEDLSKDSHYSQYNYEHGEPDTCGIPVTTALNAEGQLGGDLAAPTNGQPTNTQNDMDEADRLKISDHYVFYANENDIEVLSRNSLQPIRTLKANKNNEYLKELFVYNNKLVVLSEYSEPIPDAQENSPATDPTATSMTIMPMNDKTRMQIFDVRDEIKVESEKTFDGRINFSRMSKDGDITLVTHTGYYGTKKERIEHLTKKFAQQSCNNIQKLQNNIYHSGLTEVHSMDLKQTNKNKEDQKDGPQVLLGNFHSGFLDKNLYLSQHHYSSTGSGTRVVQMQKQKNSWKQTAQGLVAGAPISSWSFYEKGNHLFVATTGSSGWNFQSTNTLSLLKKNKDQLEITWSQSIAPGETLRSVRYTNDYAYLVTFRQADPLFVFDIKNPEKPELKGELKVPGFSSYMHPIDKNTLLGVGQSETWNLQLSLFDVSEPEAPKAIEQLEVKGGSESQYNHHAFYYSSTHSVLGLPIKSYSQQTRFLGATFFKISADGFTPLGNTDHSDLFINFCSDKKHWYQSSIKRIYSIDDRLVSLSGLGIKVHKNSQPTQILETHEFLSTQGKCTN